MTSYRKYIYAMFKIFGPTTKGWGHCTMTPKHITVVGLRNMVGIGRKMVNVSRN